MHPRFPRGCARGTEISWICISGSIREALQLAFVSAVRVALSGGFLRWGRLDEGGEQSTRDNLLAAGTHPQCEVERNAL
jgi:hypothetical protein